MATGIRFSLCTPWRAFALAFGMGSRDCVGHVGHVGRVDHRMQAHGHHFPSAGVRQQPASKARGAPSGCDGDRYARRIAGLDGEVMQRMTRTRPAHAHAVAGAEPGAMPGARQEPFVSIVAPLGKNAQSR